MRFLRPVFLGFLILLLVSCVTNFLILACVIIFNLDEHAALYAQSTTESWNGLVEKVEFRSSVVKKKKFVKNTTLRNGATDLPSSAAVRYVKDLTNVSYSSLPWAPTTFYVDMNRLQHKPNPGKVKCTRYVNPFRNLCCEMVYFIGSYKCGSTTLAIQLKHLQDDRSKHDPLSGFVDAGKEPCWVLKGDKGLSKQPGFKSCERCNSRTPSEPKSLLLDGCPFYTGMHALKLYCLNPHSKLVMLLRDPYDRLISQYSNDVRRRKLNTTLANYLKKRTNIEFSNYHSIISHFLLYFNTSQILLVQTEALNSNAPQVVNEVRRHFGLEPRNISSFWANKGEGTAGYINPDKNVDLKLLKTVSNFNSNFFQFIGYKFNWKMYHGS